MLLHGREDLYGINQQQKHRILNYSIFPFSNSAKQIIHKLQKSGTSSKLQTNINLTHANITKSRELPEGPCKERETEVDRGEKLR